MDILVHIGTILLSDWEVDAKVPQLEANLLAARRPRRLIEGPDFLRRVAGSYDATNNHVSEFRGRRFPIQQIKELPATNF